ncbi:hypothetical protein K491DRAFT_695065 [Lophiostoma macrostomum CBS 122681]|uniref:Uncharacterized protein n=1 Tax=Lophiostoma macrostomum CBS 122681 TaxID=1314788 RepID=A0A6A6T1K0_9PLEO|nr:hypothetical protein K491DRAFT_695065 [Lophiostoma macrostomum CBS 122681]
MGVGKVGKTVVERSIWCTDRYISREDLGEVPRYLILVRYFRKVKAEFRELARRDGLRARAED